MFLLNTLTVPKIKDLVDKPNEQYRDIFATLNNNKAKVPITTEQNMTEELSLFLNDLKKKGSALSNPKGSALSNPYDGENYNDISSSVVGGRNPQPSVVGGQDPHTHYSPF
jgi:hypothetical protein